MKLLVFYFGLVLFLQTQVDGFIRFGRRRRRRRRPPPQPPKNCQVKRWSEWSGCSHQCGNAGTQTRTRGKSVVECCGGRCPYHLREVRPCNRNACRNGGRPTNGHCICNPGWKGTCCEMDRNECKEQPGICQHNCHNTLGSYTCSCYSCYTKVGNKCDLRQCRIGSVCYSYGTVHPRNQCQDCQKGRETVWTNNNALSCSDGNLCTRNDRCVNGVCKGTPFTCKSCESCDGSGCKIKPGFCVIDGKCYTNGNLRPGKPCQQCNSNNPTRWTANNNLKCSDNNVRTRNDRCINGECRGQPYKCLSCQDHYNDACRLKSGYCIIKYNSVDTCYRANTPKPGNPCQWCNPSSTTSAWTNRNGISCDDGQKCTRSDKCKNGQCGGISFKCNTQCQYCDGNGCSLNTGFGYVSGKCTCKIAGKDYNHQHLNPSNECQWCDLYDKVSKPRSAWTNKPAVTCNDGNACTKQDLCKNGRCVGKAYSCRSSYPRSSCIQRSECVGDGTCRDIKRTKGTICRPSTDKCDQSERCDGTSGTCVPQVIDKITLQGGKVALTASNFASTITYQSTTDKLYLKLTGFSVTCGELTMKWSLLKGKDSCALGNNPASLSSKKNHALSGLTLRNDEAYKVVVQISDIRGQTGLPVCSNEVTIDTSRPTGGWIRDGAGSKDVQFQSSKIISATWGGFKTTYGVAKYETAVYHGTIVLQSFTNVNLRVSFTKTFSAIADGSKIVTKVRAFTKAGLYSEIASNGVTVDTTKPKPGAVSDGSTSDLKYASWTTTYDASWTQFTDPHSPIVEYKVGVKRKEAGLVSSGLTSVGLKRTGQVSGLTLTSGIQYCAIVEGINAAGLSIQASSNCLLIDHDAPRPGTVNDGSSEDIDYQSSDNTFHANWGGFDDGQKGSGLAEYRYKLTDKHNKDVTSWASAGLQTNTAITDLSLVNGNTYYITVRAVDKVGHYKEVKSDGVFVDTSHPVYTGSLSVEGEKAQKGGETVVYIRHKDSLTVSWPQFIDQHSGMKKYQWTIVESGAKPTSWKDVPGVKLATKAVLSSLSLTNNKEYQLTIRGINNAGLYADIKSPPLIPLSKSPNLGTVSDGEDPTIDIDYQTNTSEIHATWQGFETANVKIRAYFIAVGSCIKGNYHVTNNQFIPVSPATATSFGIQGLSLVNGQKYCIKIKAENLAAVQTDTASSDGFIVDVTPPDLKRAMVLDGSGDDDIDYQSSREEISATWTGIKEHESGIKRFEVAVSRNRGGQPDVTTFTDVGHNTSAKIRGLSLNNEVYYVIVCAINNAGLKSCLASDGVLIDPTPSTSGVVHDGIIEPDIRYQSSTTKMSANWERIWDLESRVKRFEWGIGEEHVGHRSVLDFVDVGLQTHVTSEKVLALRHGHNYTVFLRVYNRAGGMRELRSNGVTIDTTPPVQGDLILGSEWSFDAESGTYYSSTASEIYVSWEDFKEPESELWYYKWGIGTTKCGTQVQPLINIGLSTSANTSGSGLKLRPGVPYYVTVVARNRANLASRICSSPLLIDNTPPRAGYIQLTTNMGIAKTYFNPGEHPRVTWFDFEDMESGIQFYAVFIVRNHTTIFRNIFTAKEANFDVSLSNLPEDTGYVVVFRTFNYVGLETRVYSEPFTIDNTPPFYTGREDALPRRRFQSSSDTLKVAWESFKDNESPVEFYELGIGTQAKLDNIHKFTRTGLRKDFQLRSLNLKENQTYYVTVRALNAAGLATTLLLEELVIDQTLPTAQNGSVKDGRSGYDIDFMSLNDSVSATWENIKDQESGIDMFEYCVGTTPFNCVIKPFNSVGRNTSFVCQDCKIQAEVKVFTRVRATNGAGISAIFTSNGFTVDSSPPEIGHVLDGEKAETPDVEKVDRDWLPTVTWYGAQDIQSGLRECQWIIEMHDNNEKLAVYNKTLDKANITYNVRHTERASAQQELSTNASYFSAIRCTNNAGITSYQYSNGWSAVDQWPVTSYVYDGLASRDLEYDIMGEALGASWGAFYGDAKDPVIGYEWAVGTLGEPEDIMEYTEVGLHTRVSKLLSDSNIELEPGVKYYVTVRATSLSGRTSNKSSNGFIVDKTAPTAGVVKVTHKIMNQTANEIDYTLTWEGFEDLETGIRRYEFCLGYIKDVCSIDLKTAGLELQGTVEDFTPADLNTPFYGIVIATNNAGLKTTVSSKAIKIDFTPPIPGTVIDGVDKDVDSINDMAALVTTWSGFADPETGLEKCRLSVTEEGPSGVHLILRSTVNGTGSRSHKFIVIPGVKYTSMISCRNPDGFKTSVSSNGVVCDSTPPIAGKIFHGTDQNPDIGYQSSTKTLEVYWSPGHDPESSVKEYLFAVGTVPDNDDVRGFVTVGMETKVIIVNLTMNSGSTYYVTLEVVNNAGLKSRVSSTGVRVDATAPIITEVNLQSSDTASGFIGPGDHLSGNWSNYDDESDIAFTEYCIGTTAGGCQTHDMQRVSDNHTSVTCFKCKLRHRHTYFMTIRAWNKARLFRLATTKGVSVDLTPPTSGVVEVNTFYMPCMEKCDLRATFSGFTDEESGIERCEFSIRTSNGKTVTAPQVTTNKNDLLATNLTLKHGESYKIVVACVNFLGTRSKEVESAPVRIDNTRPEKGLVIISPDSNHDLWHQHTGCHFLNATLRVYWTGFHDNESHIAGFRVAIGRAPLGKDIIPYKEISIDSEAKFELSQQYGLSRGDTIFATVEAKNRAGLVTKVSSQPTRLLSDTDSNLLNEQDFQCVNF